MLSLGNKCTLHLSLTAALLLVGGALKVDWMETNVLRSHGNGSSEINISSGARRMLDPKENRWFRYSVEGEEFRSRILSVTGGEDGGPTTLLLETKHSGPLLNATYRIGRRSLWSAVLGT